VPDSTGTLRCLTGEPNDGGIVCVAAGGACTATGDCCTGYICNITPGAGSGTCGTPVTPTDGGTACGLYGQACNDTTPCCAGSRCNYSPTNTACAPGQTGCTCFTPLVIGSVGGP
jgi:hypothetical protein